MLVDSRLITVVTVRSVFSAVDRSVTTAPWRDGITVADLMPVAHPYSGVELVCSVNGKVAEDSTPVYPGDVVVTCPVPQGDAGDLLRTVAMIAVAAVATMVAGPVAGWATSSAGLGWGYSASVALGYMASAAVFVGGSMMVNAVLPPSAPDVPQVGRDAWNESPTYGWGPLRQTEGQGHTIPILFGKMRVAGHVLTKFIETSGAKQYYHVMLGVADVPVNDAGVTFSDVEINDQPADYFDGVTIETRAGLVNDAVIENFDQVVWQEDYANKLIYNNAVQAVTKGDAVQRVEIDITAPYGIYYSNDKAGLDQREADVKVEYREYGSGTWILHSNQVITGKTTEPVRKTIAINLAAGQWEIQLTRTNTESTKTREKTAVYFVAMREIVKRALIYPGLAKYAVVALGTDQLSGGEPSITVLAERATVRVYNPYTPGWESKSAENPGWAYYALATAHHGIATSRMLYDEIKAFADYCDTDFGGRTRFRLSLYLDTAADFWTQAQQILQIGRAIPVRRGTKYGLVAEMPSTPVQMFNMGTIKAGSFTLDYLGFSDRANSVEVAYKDEERNYETQTIPVFTDDYDTATTDRRASKRIYGCPSREQAIADAVFLLNSTNNLVRTITHDVDINGLALQVGDLYYFGHSAPYWSTSGRIVSAALDTIYLDTAVEQVAGPYAILLQAADDTIFDKTVASIATGSDGNTVVTLETPFTSGELAKIAKYDPYQFGRVDSYKRIYRCVGLERAGDLSKKVIGVEYNESLYDMTKVIDLPEIAQKFRNAYGVFAHEYMDFAADGTYRSAIGVSWHSRVTTPQNWEVWVKDITSGSLIGPYMTTALSMNVPAGKARLGHTYKIYVTPPNRGAVDYGNNTAEVYINGKDDAPPDVDVFTIDQYGDGTRKFTFSMADRPVDLAGYRIRYKLGTTANWDDMTPLADDLIVTSPFETNELAAGEYVFAIKAEDYSGNLSETDTQIVAELGDPRLGNALFVATPTGTWGGTKTNCWLDTKSGTLIAKDQKTWADFAIDGVTWADWTTWARSPYTTVSYEHTAIDLGAALRVTPLVTVGGTGTQTIEMDYSQDNVTWNGWTAVAQVTARYFKFKVTMVVSAGTLATISSMRIVISGEAVTEELNDLNTATLSSSYRVAAGRIYLPLTKNFTVVSQISLAMQSVGAGWSWEVIDKTHTVSGKLAPEIKIYNASNVLADATIDVYVRGT